MWVQFHVNMFKQCKPTTSKQSSQLPELLAKQEIQLHRCIMNEARRRMARSKPGRPVSLRHESLHTSVHKDNYLFFLAYLREVGLHTNTSPALTQTETAGELQSQVIFFSMLKIYHSVRKCNMGNEARQRVLWCYWTSTNDINTALNRLGFNQCDSFCSTLTIRHINTI